MKVLVLEETAELAELIGIYLSAVSSSEIVTTHLTDDAVKQILDSDFSVFFCGQSFAQAGSDLALQEWKHKNPDSQIIILGTEGLPSGLNVTQINPIHLVQELKELVNSPFWRKLVGQVIQNPLPLSPYLVYKLGICPADLYLKLGKDNWVKLFHKNSPFGENERNKFEAKGLKEFWVLSEDIELALGHFEDLLGSLSMDMSGDEALVSDSIELAWHLISESGFREDIQKVVKVAMHQTLAITRKNPQLKDFLEKILRDKHGHLVKHSMISAHVACGIAAQLGWTSEQTYLKLTVAALMHDILMPNLDSSENVWHDALASAKGDVKNNPECRSFLQHSLEGAELLRRFRDIPPDTDKIVLEHHELPDGSGFPRGFTSSQISPLGCLFIISHHVSDLLLEFKEDKIAWDKQILIEKLVPERWQTGNFKKIWQALENTSLF